MTVCRLIRLLRAQYHLQNSKVHIFTSQMPVNDVDERETRVISRFA